LLCGNAEQAFFMLGIKSVLKKRIRISPTKL